MYKLRQQIVEIGHRLWLGSMLPAGDGNISVRLEHEKFLITASGVSKGFLTARQVLLIDSNGTVLDGEGQPSSELVMHLVAYRLRGDIDAIVHAHPPFASAFACNGIELPYDMLSEAIVKIGKIPTVPFELPSSISTAEGAAPFAKDFNAFLLKNHGAVALGRDLDEAFLRMELVEHLAKTALIARILGGYDKIPTEAIAALEEMAKS